MNFQISQNILNNPGILISIDILTKNNTGYVIDNLRDNREIEMINQNAHLRRMFIKAPIKSFGQYYHDDGFAKYVF